MSEYKTSKELTKELSLKGFDFSEDPFADEEPEEEIVMTKDDVLEFLGYQPEKDSE